MCGIIAAVFPNPEEKDFDFIRNLFLQSMIRGKHATGVTFRYGVELKTIKEPISAINFLQKYNIKDWKDFDGGIRLIGHVRYSTSDLQYNQPISTYVRSIVHNGIISQEDPINWKERYGYSCDTKNDSELILQYLQKNQGISDKHPLIGYPDSSQAVCYLMPGKLTFWRNGLRPLYYARIPGRGGIVASTKNIIERSNIYVNIEIVKTKMNQEYDLSFIDGDVTELSYYPTNKEDLQNV